MAIQYKDLCGATLICRDLERTAAFYEQLGLERVREDTFAFQSGQTLTLRQGDYPSRKDDTKRSFVHMCFQLDDHLAGNQDILDRGIQVYSTRVSRGVRLEAPDDLKQGACGCYNSFFRDPEGNDIELQQYTALSKQLL